MASRAPPATAPSNEEQLEVAYKASVEALHYKQPRCFSWAHTIAPCVFPNADLSPELTDRILSLLDPHHLASLSLVSRAAYLACSSDVLWKPTNEVDQRGRLPGQSWKAFGVERALEPKRRAIRLEYVQELVRSWSKRRKCGRRRINQLPTVEVERPQRVSVESLWPQHPNETDEIRPELRHLVDHVIEAQEFLTVVNQLFGTIEDVSETCLMRSVYDYYRFMMLKAEHPDEYLVPPINVELVWQSHLLRPDAYARDCDALFGGLVGHHVRATPIEQDQRVEALKATAKLWEEKYSEAMLEAGWDEIGFEWARAGRLGVVVSCELYFGAATRSSNEAVPSDWSNPMSVSWMDLQKDFMWWKQYEEELADVVWTLRRQRAFTARAVKAYERFLYLCCVHRSAPRSLHPSCFIDLVWHTHMLDPHAYRQDCMRLVGEELIHTPWPSDYDDAVACETSSLWAQEFGADFKMEWQAPVSVPTTAAHDTR